ncbi:hypothetical protein GGR57DRAFT_488092 [Xylariaceae sp. FL1272]|nr:hypothetical protein GGR57DRAFT_488092 [Xylariaceae sp. FL1272]
MKSAVALAGLALLRSAAALCCRGDRCLMAIVSPANDGGADCSANLVVTVTPAASTVTKTTTAIVEYSSSAVAHRTEVEIGSTRTVVITLDASTTVTAVTDTTAFETASATVTLTETAATVTTTSDVYAQPAVRRAASSAPAGLIPFYASGVCDSWDRYVNACKCVGVTATTVTAPAVTSTVTVPASTTISSIVSTISVTIVDTILSTATTSTSTTDTFTLTKTSTSVETDTVTATQTSFATVTATSVVEQQCAATDVDFRVSTPFPDGTTRYLNVIGSSFPAWQTFSTNPSASSLATSTWKLNSDGIWTLSASGMIMYINLSTTGPTGLAGYVNVGTAAAVEAGVASGQFVKVQGCTDADSGKISMSAHGRTSILSCGNGLYLTSDPASRNANCLLLNPDVAPAPTQF